MSSLSISPEEKKEAHEEAARLLTELRDLGLSFERISVSMGEVLGGADPSVTSLKRWKAGKNLPSPAFSFALATVYKKEKENG